jgi:hypothetical protein
MSAESVATWVLACCTRRRIELVLVLILAVLEARAVAFAGFVARWDLTCWRRFRSAEKGRRRVLMLAAAALVAGSDAVEALGFARVAGVSLVTLVVAFVLGSVDGVVLSVV